MHPPLLLYDIEVFENVILYLHKIQKHYFIMEGWQFSTDIMKIYNFKFVIFVTAYSLKRSLCACHYW